MNHQTMNHSLLGFVAALLLAPAAARVDAGTICFDAQDANRIEPPVRIWDGGEDSADRKVAAAASGGKFIEIPEGAGDPPQVGGEAVYEFEIAQPGRYRFWGRAWWPNSCGNSFTWILNDDNPFVFGRGGTHEHWHWVRGMMVTLQPGRHTLRVLNREDGARLDQILITRNLRFVPTGIEEVTVRLRPDEEDEEDGEQETE